MIYHIPLTKTLGLAGRGSELCKGPTHSFDDCGRADSPFLVSDQRESVSIRNPNLLALDPSRLRPQPGHPLSPCLQCSSHPLSDAPGPVPTCQILSRFASGLMSPRTGRSARLYAAYPPVLLPTNSELQPKDCNSGIGLSKVGTCRQCTRWQTGGSRQHEKSKEVSNRTFLSWTRG